MKKHDWSKRILTGIIALVAVFGPWVAYAGVSVIYPESAHTIDVNDSPPITFAQGGDYTDASSLGFLSSWVSANDGASFTITVSALGGGELIIDDYVTATVDASVTSFTYELSTAIAYGTLTNANFVSFYLCAWQQSGASPAPTNSEGSECGDPDGAGGTEVCGSLDLESAATTKSTGGPCDDAPATTKMQLYLKMGSGANDATPATVSIRPADILFD